MRLILVSESFLGWGQMEKNKQLILPFIFILKILIVVVIIILICGMEEEYHIELLSVSSWRQFKSTNLNFLKVKPSPHAFPEFLGFVVGKLSFLKALKLKRGILHLFEVDEEVVKV